MADYLDGLYQGVNEHFNSEMKLELQGETMGFEEKRALKHQVFAGRHWLGQQNKQLRLARASSSGEAGTIRRQWKQLQGGLGDNPEEALGTDKQTVEFEARLVLVCATSQAQHRAVGEDDLQS